MTAIELQILQQKRQSPPSKPLMERLSDYSYVDENGCWIWIAAKKDGYGKIHIPRQDRTLGQKRDTTAYRAAYEAYIGPVPKGLHLDHLCRVRACINPAHLEPVTPAENNRRMALHVIGTFRVTHCKRGHEYTADNTKTIRNYRHGQTNRTCLACSREYQREYQRKLRAEKKLELKRLQRAIRIELGRK